MKNVKTTKQKNASKAKVTRKTTSKKAKPNRKVKSATTARRKNTATEPSAATTSYVTIAEQDLILLQTTNHLGMSGLEDLFFEGFAANERSRRAETQWLAFGSCDMPHYMGKSSWIGHRVASHLPSSMRFSVPSRQQGST